MREAYDKWGVRRYPLTVSRLKIFTRIDNAVLELESGNSVGSNLVLHGGLRLQRRDDLPPVGIERLVHGVVHEVDVELVHAEIL